MSNISMEDHLALVRRLHRLSKAVDAALDMVQREEFRPVTPAEAQMHAILFGERTMILGEFVVTERNPPQEACPACAVASPSRFYELNRPLVALRNKTP